MSASSDRLKAVGIDTIPCPPPDEALQLANAYRHATPYEGFDLADLHAFLFLEESEEPGTA